MNKYAVIVAGGKGTRMGGDLPKQFLTLGGRPVLFHSVITFMETFPGIHIILVLPEQFVSLMQTVVEALPGSERIQVVTGGETRFHSVRNGLLAIEGDGIVFVHDGARPLASSALLRRCYEQAKHHGTAIPALTVAESVRRISASDSKPVNRDDLRIIQTPQTFRSELILQAFRLEYSPTFTDEATVAEAAGIPVSLVEGERRNLKITTPEDLIIAEAFLRQDAQIRPR
jgi:2-C-methyl-D-erythritol 4-phosphate cytidylyltransferase